MTPTQGEHAQPEALRLAKYVARRKLAKQLDANEIHGFDSGCDTEAVLLLSDIEAVLARVAALTAAQPAAPQGGAYVENPAEIEHVAGDVSKNRAESNMTGWAYAELADKLQYGSFAFGFDREWASIRRNVLDEAVKALRASHGQAPAVAAPVLCVSSKAFNRMKAGDDSIKAWLPPATDAEDMLLYAAPTAQAAPAAGAVSGPVQVAGAARTFGYWQTHPVHEPLGDHSHIPLTTADKADGWTEVPLAAAPTPAAQQGDATPSVEATAKALAWLELPMHVRQTMRIRAEATLRAALAQKEGK